MQIVKVDNRTGPEFHAADFIRGRASSGMIPRSDNEIMFRARFGRRVRHVITIKCHRAKLIAIVLPGYGQDRQRHFLKLLAGRHHRVVVGVGGRMFQNALKVLRRIADERVERAEGDMLFVSVEKFRSPELRVPEKILLTSPTAGVGEPLHVV